MRRGFSLIELLAVMTVASVIFGVLGVSIFALHRTQTRVQDDSHTAAALADFARRLRADAHAATAASLQTDGDAEPSESLVLDYDDGRRIEYRFDTASRRIHREVRQADEIVHRDAFVLPRGAEVRWSPLAEGETLAGAVVSRPQGRERDAGEARRVRIEAAVGLDRRYGRSSP